MIRSCSWLAALLLLTHLAASAAIAADSAEPQACIDVAKRPVVGSASDRFLREWCQRNAGKPAEAPAEAPAAAPEPPKPTPELPSYPSDSADDRFNSSRLPPGYHCHMLKFGERICHGGLD